MKKLLVLCSVMLLVSSLVVSVVCYGQKAIAVGLTPNVSLNPLLQQSDECPELEAPEPGATGVTLSPAFQWSGVDWATGYEFVLANNPDFTNPLAEETVTVPVYLYGGTLSSSTTYYWKVRAVSATSQSVWAIATFTTMAEPVSPSEPAPPVEIPPPATTPGYIWGIIGIGGLITIITIIVVIIIIVVIAILLRRRKRKNVV